MSRLLILPLLGLGLVLSAAGCLGKSKARPPSPFPAAPALTGGPWLNTSDGKPITLASRKGKPTLVAFWTYACSNCQNNFAPYSRLLKQFRSSGVELISIHTPELDRERDLGNVAQHVKKFNIDYPVLIDGSGENWRRWHQEYWPTLYVLDSDGGIRLKLEGELNFDGAQGEEKVATLLRSLLASGS